MKKLMLFGDPVEHSLSPAMQNAALSAAGLPVRYVAARVPVAELGEALRRAREEGCLGLNLTLPLKEAAIPYLDALDEEARLIGAVNAVAFRDGRALGFNTDGRGFLWSLRDLAGFEPAGRRAVVVGAGGAARAVAFALAQAGVDRVDLINRTRVRAEALARDLDLTGAVFAPEETAAAEALGSADLVVNCTTQGLWPDVAGLPPADPRHMRPDALAADTIYNPRPSRWLALAARRGCRTLDGLGMLAGQAAAAWEAWFGMVGPAREMLAEAARALDESGR